jgi:hypothetical protein
MRKYPDQGQIAQHIQSLAAQRKIQLTIHGHQEMVAEEITIVELLSALGRCTVLENYPDHKRGACCLVCGQADSGRHLHVVCTTERPELVIITMYEPKPPKWETPFKRGMQL